MKKPIIVIDTDVLVSTAAQYDHSPGPSVWASVREGRVVAVTSQAALDELQDVACRPKVLAAIPRLCDQFPKFLEEYRTLAVKVPEPLEHFVLHSDPKDSLFFNLAIEANAFGIVSFDKRHVLAVAAENHPQHQEWMLLSQGLRIIHPKNFAREIEHAHKNTQGHSPIP